LTPSIRDHRHIAVRVADPDFPLARIGVLVRLFDDLRLQRAGGLDRGIEVGGLEP
jgi:hypothetical protein